MTLRAIVLGAAAGGGFPQWNCRCAGCRLAWAGDPRTRFRTQASVAVSGDGANWVLLNASPDLTAQIRANSALQPKEGTRGSPIAAVVLTGAEIDQVTGLLSMRERGGFALFGPPLVLKTIFENPIFAPLDTEEIRREAVAFGQPFPLPGGVEAELFAVPGKVPLYLEKAASADQNQFNAGLLLKKDGRSILFVPGAASVPPALAQRAADADLIFFDGTLYTDDEMIRMGAGTKTGRRMGHIPVAGADGSMATVNGKGKRVFLHINNTNPILIDGSPESEAVKRGGWDVAYDGMEFVL